MLPGISEPNAICMWQPWFWLLFKERVIYSNWDWNVQRHLLLLLSAAMCLHHSHALEKVFPQWALWSWVQYTVSWSMPIQTNYEHSFFNEETCREKQMNCWITLLLGGEHIWLTWEAYICRLQQRKKWAPEATVSYRFLKYSIVSLTISNLVRAWSKHAGWGC